MIVAAEEGWDKKQKILFILAHPDDPEFFCGATIARWVELGHEVGYCLLTKGDKGGDDFDVTPSALAGIREVEQRHAAAVLGVEKIRYLGFEDGYLVADIEARKAVTRVIREEKPDVLVTCDPTNYIPRTGYLNHPDHRATGQIVCDAVFPCAGNPHYFPELLKEGLLPHKVKELWFSLPAVADFILDVTRYWERKIQALYEHKSQIGDKKAFTKRMRGRHTPDSSPESPRYEERFKRIVFS